ncbi:hypothetical protein EC957_005495 [Mortierella hygrophila]|uniref:Uncharacterized protein n=1 Tax=Mortierella hygrophila TaxID=979708 RepID=A0A9P6K6P0_9FUNG|nr:hypothetical protein EC957_005495 [Mortierella hygrophila]
MIHLPVKKEPDSEQGHNKLDMVHKGSKRHLEYRERNVESLDEDRVDQHMEGPDSERPSQCKRPFAIPVSRSCVCTSICSGTYTYDTSNKFGTGSGGDFIVSIIGSSFVIGSVGTGSSGQRGREQWQQQEANDACEAQVSRV